MKRQLVTVAMLVCALLCYGVGWNTGAGALIAAGGILEVVFWWRVVRDARSDSRLLRSMPRRRNR